MARSREKNLSPPTPDFSVPRDTRIRRHLQTLLPSPKRNSARSLTIQKAIDHYDRSDKTICRWIKAGRLTAALEDGIWYVYPDEQDNVSSEIVQPDIQGFELDLLRSENQYLRERLASRDKELEAITELLRLTTQQNSGLLEKLLSQLA